MRAKNRLFIKPFFLPLILLCVLSVSFPDASARAQECGVLICKLAVSAAEGTLFPFVVREGNATQTIEVEANGPCFLLDFSAAASLVVVEAPFPGWKLDELFCTLPLDINVDFTPGGVVLSCVGSETGTAGTCNFSNVEGTETAAIPTLTEWGMIAAAAGLMMIGVFFAIRRKRAQAA